MGADLSQSEGEPISAINVTPFVDVVLVLLVIFMITAPALMKESILIKLPKSSVSDGQIPESFGVGINKQGQFLWNGEMIGEADLLLRAKEALAKNPEVRAILSADEEARHGDVVAAIDVIKTAGVERFAVEIRKP